MRILWFNWKDMRHPQAGGAELLTEGLLRRLVQDGHELTLFAASFDGAAPTEIQDGITVIRRGSRYTVHLYAWRYYRKHLKSTFDLIVDEVNTLPFFARFYTKAPTLIFIHQLARQIWFHEMLFPLSLIGYLLEPLYLRLLSGSRVVTVSESTKRDLIRCGFRSDLIGIISEGIRLTPVADLAAIAKFTTPTILSIGEIRSMKRTLHIVKAFEVAKQLRPELELVIAGSYAGTYGAKVAAHIAKSCVRDSIHLEGRVSEGRKIELLQKSHILAVTSVKEGWGLVVTEANSQGTSAVVYNIDGLRDSVRHNETGVIVENNTPDALASSLVKLLNDRATYDRLRQAGWEWSKQITFDKSYEDFKTLLAFRENSAR
jgi:glycosyltransferase involved in cell wall biosynthesis